MLPKKRFRPSRDGLFYGLNGKKFRNTTKVHLCKKHGPDDICVDHPERCLWDTMRFELRAGLSDKITKHLINELDRYCYGVYLRSILPDIIKDVYCKAAITFGRSVFVLSFFDFITYLRDFIRIMLIEMRNNYSPSWETIEGLSKDIRHCHEYMRYDKEFTEIQQKEREILNVLSEIKHDALIPDINKLILSYV